MTYGYNMPFVHLFLSQITYLTTSIYQRLEEQHRVKGDILQHFLLKDYLVLICNQY